MNDLTQRFLEQMRAKGLDERMELPPPFVKYTEGEYVAYEPGRSARMVFPIKPDYNNPFGITFGGFYGMFFDHAFGPFSGLETGQPTTSLDLNITFLKPLSAADGQVAVDVEIVSQTKTYLLLQGRAYNPAGQLVATAASRMLIMNRP